LRDMVMRKIEMSTDEYMELKKQLSEELVGETKLFDEKNVKALADAFEVSETEAGHVLQECGNDLRTAMKLLRMKQME